MRHRLLSASLALLVLTALFLALPVVSAAGPQPVPVTTVADEVPMGPLRTAATTVTLRPDATTVPEAPVGAPVRTVTRTHVRTFSMVGVTWVLDPAVTGTVVRVRVQNAAGAWGHWTEVGPEDAVPNRDAARGRVERGGTAPLWTGPSTGVQAELTTHSGARPADVKLDLIDPGTSAADSALGRPAIRDTAHAASSMPPVYSRGQWGADESIRSWDPQYASTIKAATIHHSADTNDYTADQVPALMRAIYHYHAVTLGWGDIGYNVVVDKFGRMWEGRYGGLASTVIGAHAGGFNTYTFGVSMLGNYDLVDTPPAVISAVASIISWKFSLYGVNPLGKTTLISGGGGTDKYAPGVPVTLPTIFAHRDVGATVCPGRYAYARMDQIRNLVAGTVVDLTQISKRYDSDAALRTLLGPQTAAPTLTTDRSGGYATYQNGALYYSAATGVRMVQGPVRDLWTATGAQAGILRYPTADVTATPDAKGQFATFQGGAIYSTPATGTRAVLGPIQTLWNATGAQTGALGYPTWSVSNLAGGGQYATFEHGSVYWTSATGARIMLGPIEAFWKALGAQNGVLGYPTQSVSTAADGVGQYARFQNGSIFWSQGTGARAMLGPVGDAWTASGGISGALGYPTRSVSWAADHVGQYADFEHGSIYWSPSTGAHTVSGAVRDAWVAGGAEHGPLGYPTSDVSVGADGVSRYAHFRFGSVYASTGGVQTLVGGIRDAWVAAGGDRGVLGAPTSSNTRLADGVGQSATFAHGSVVWSPTTGSRVLWGPIETLWKATGAQQGPLGYPTRSVSWAADHVGRYARFQNGSIFWSPTTGARGVSGPIETRWVADGAEHGRMGYPTRTVSWAADHVGRYARFQHGAIYWSPSTGAREVRGAFLTAWAAVGSEHGVLGYPIGEPYAVTGGQWQKFQHGYVAHSTATGRTWAVRQ